MLDPMLTLPAFKALEATINLATGLLPEVRQELAEQQGKVVALQCTDPALSLYLQLGENCRVLSHSDEITAGLSGELGDWLNFIRASDKASELINGDLKLEGDSKWLIQLGDSLGKLDIDWEDELAKVIGDVPAHLIGTRSKQLFETLAPLAEVVREPAKNLLATAFNSAREIVDTAVAQRPSNYDSSGEKQD